MLLEQIAERGLYVPALQPIVHMPQKACVLLQQNLSGERNPPCERTLADCVAIQHTHVSPKMT